MSSFSTANDSITDGADFVPSWSDLPDNLVMSIFMYLPPRSTLNAALSCRRWQGLAYDELLWKYYFQREFNLPKSVTLAPGKTSWRSEFRRLMYCTPRVESEVIQDHRDQVLHVSFSHSGRMFCTTSKDGFVKVWNSDYPCSCLYYEDMRKYTWKYTQFSQFNCDDNLLLVSGVHFGSNSTSGEIAVFSLTNGFELQCRVLNKPYDVFGTWFNSDYLLSGNLRWRADLTSSSELWLNKAHQSFESDQESVVRCLYQFLNKYASSIRAIVIAKCCDETEESSDCANKSSQSVSVAPVPLQANISDSFSYRKHYRIGRNHGKQRRLCNRYQSNCDRCTTSDDIEGRHSLQGELNISLKSNHLAANHGQCDDYYEFKDVSSLMEGIDYRGDYDDNHDDDVESDGSDNYYSAENLFDVNQVIAHYRPDNYNYSCNSTGFDSYSSVDPSSFMQTARDTAGSNDIFNVHVRHSTGCRLCEGSDVDSTSSLNNRSALNSNYSDLTNDYIVTDHSSCSSPGDTGLTEGSCEINHLDSLCSASNYNPTQEKRSNVASIPGDKCSQQDKSTAARVSDDTDKWLIFTTGERTYTPHQIGMKRIRAAESKSLVTAMKTGGDKGRLGESTHESSSESDKCDLPDHVIELHGHIIGMCLSPDHRYLFVNSRAWPKDCKIEDPLDPPPISSEVDIHIIDLKTKQEVGNLVRAHKAYTPNDECFFIFLDVSDEYVASGAEDKNGNLWDRHYGICLQKFRHEDVVNGAAFNPADPHMLVTVSDDHRFKIWRSKERQAQLLADNSD